VLRRVEVLLRDKDTILSEQERGDEEEERRRMGERFGAILLVYAERRPRHTSDSHRQNPRNTIHLHTTCVKQTGIHYQRRTH
jgi:hypothetical protein